ncbi:hypothetical protein [Sporosarcina limicola]|uniref:Uncharacterized protein n=1 Tax=Sporosarcina limicola TaxID=34101 RepID=A0A927R5J1_9BACL|nr:hypothetical protein [Sporosarcina limicola]MBE1556098.1 hypothetical protein [Sporosarcina limicola]
MKTFFQNSYFGFILLFLYVLLNYFGSIQRMNIMDLDSYMYEATKDIEGSGTVFALIAYDPIFQVLFSFVLMIFLAAIFLLARFIFLTVTSAKIWNGMYVIFAMTVLYLMFSVGSAAIHHMEWGIYLLVLQECMLILFGVFALGHIKLLRGT